MNTHTPAPIYSEPTNTARAPADMGKLLTWANFTRRLASMAERNPSSLLTVDIIVDERGRPVQWTAPTGIRLEPSR